MNTKPRKKKLLKKQIHAFETRLNRFNQQNQHYSVIRISIFIFFLVSIIVLHILNFDLIFNIFLYCGMFIFFTVVVLNNFLIRKIKKYTIYKNIKKEQLHRMELNWNQINHSENAPNSTTEPLENDLDLVGQFSLFHLINNTITHNGADLLKKWLTFKEISYQNIKKRQSIVKSLKPLNRFRIRFYLNYYSSVHSRALDDNRLLKWILQTHTSNVFLISFFLTGLQIVTLILIILYSLGAIQAIWIFSFLAYIILFLLNQNKCSTILQDSIFIEDELRKIETILKFLEKYPLKKELAQLLENIQTSTKPPSKVIHYCKWICALSGLSGNPILSIIFNLIVPWNYYCAHLLNHCGKILKHTLPKWIESINYIEAYSSLAEFAYLNPEYTFPLIQKTDINQKIFQAKQIGHPLIPDQEKRTNDFQFDSSKKIAIITGSNMSGKSTFLRSIGINLALAYAGAPVNAQSMAASVFEIFSCIKINDSLSDHLSYFYTEVKRLKVLIDILQNSSQPVFFLIDEIFKGTNNKERLIGSTEYIKLIANYKNGMGLITTHDLELVNLENSIKTINNYHFRETIVNNQMSFDYQIHPGPCPTTNALKIMRLEGLIPNETDTGD